MKSSIHLFYGIIIGILLVACTGSLKEDKAEFEEEKILALGGNAKKDANVAKYKKMGWTFIDYEIVIADDMPFHYVLAGK